MYCFNEDNKLRFFGNKSPEVLRSFLNSGKQYRAIITLLVRKGPESVACYMKLMFSDGLVYWLNWQSSPECLQFVQYFFLQRIWVSQVLLDLRASSQGFWWPCHNVISLLTLARETTSDVICKGNNWGMS